MENDYFPLLKLKMWFFVQEFAAELPFLSSVKIIFQKFRFFSQILSPIRLGAILCAHAILCAPTVLHFEETATLKSTSFRMIITVRRLIKAYRQESVRYGRDLLVIF